MIIVAPTFNFEGKKKFVKLQLARLLPKDALFNSLQVYICGGFNGNECLPTAECYKPETDQWTLIASMGDRRSGIGVIAYADRVFAVSTGDTVDTHLTQKHSETQKH